MIVINSNMSGEAPRLNLVTSSRDFLTTVDYPLRPNVFRTFGQPPRPRSRWNCCYFPQSFPVYRMQRFISVLLCLLVMILLSVIAFVLVQVAPTQPSDKNRSVSPGDAIENGVGSAEDYRKQELGLGLVRTARKLEDHPEYKRSVEDFENDEDEDYPDDEDEDELILNSYGDNGYDDEQEYNPVFDMKYFDFSKRANEGKETHKYHEPLENKNLKVPSSSFKTPNIRQSWENLPKMSLINNYKIIVIENGIVFSEAVEELLNDKELSDTKIGQIQDNLRSNEVKVLQEPTWERCGRPKNQWLDLSSGGGACARYRYPDDYLLVGEVLSFYLSKLLGVGHVPPVVLSEPTGAQWQQVKSDMKKAGWGDAPVVVLTPWFEGLVRDHMPSILLEAVMTNGTLSILTDFDDIRKLSDNRVNSVKGHFRKGKQSLERDLKELKESVKLGNIEVIPRASGVAPEVVPASGVSKKPKEDHTNDGDMHSQLVNDSTNNDYIINKDALKKGNVIDVASFQNLKNSKFGIPVSTKLKELSERDLMQLLQWSDLLIFDYLTGNYDRVAYMQDAAEKEGRMQILSRTIHNLVRSKTTNALWLLDNESGLLDSYTLLYGTTDPMQSNRFLAFHKQMLESMCLFRKSTMEAVLGLLSHPEPHVLLVDFVKHQEPLFHLLPDPLKNAYFVKYFPLRIKEVYEWISKCIDKVQGHSIAR